MSYKGINVNCANAAAAFALFTAGIVEMGWTLHDTVSASDKVYSSAGESGLEPTGYIRITLNSDNIYVRPYLYWDEIGHAGYVTYSAYFTWTSGRAGIYGDKDTVVFMVTQTGSNPSLFVAGHLKEKTFATPKATLTSAAFAGDDAVLTVDSTAGFVVDRRYTILGVNTGNNFEGRDQIQVTEITDSTHMVVSNLPRNYASGAIISPLPSSMFSARFRNNTGLSGLASEYTYTLINQVAAGTASPSMSVQGGIRQLFLNATSVEKVSDYVLLTPWGIYNADYLFGHCGNSDILMGPGALDDLYGVMSGTNIPVQGTASSGGDNTLTDSAKEWTTDEHENRYVMIIAGAGTGQIRRVVSNTATELTVSNNWDTNPDATSQYRIVDQAWRQLPAGFAVRETNWATGE